MVFIWPEASDPRQNNGVKSLWFHCLKAGARRELNTVLPLYFSLPSSLFPSTHKHTFHWQTFLKCSLLKAPNDIPSVSECWFLFVQWTQWLRKRSKHYYHIITGVIRALFGAHVALGGLGSVLERHSFSDRAFIYLQYIVPSFPYASPPLGRPLKGQCWCQYSRENEVQWWGRRKASKQERGITDHRLTWVLHGFCFQMQSNQGKNILNSYT